MCRVWDPGSFSIYQGCGSGYYYVRLVSKSKNFWMVNNISLVESESCTTFIPLVGEFVNELISTGCLNVGLYFFTAEHHIPEIRHRAGEL